MIGIYILISHFLLLLVQVVVAFVVVFLLGTTTLSFTLLSLVLKLGYCQVSKACLSQQMLVIHHWVLLKKQFQPFHTFTIWTWIYKWDYIARTRLNCVWTSKQDWIRIQCVCRAYIGHINFKRTETEKAPFVSTCTSTVKGTQLYFLVLYWRFRHKEYPLRRWRIDQRWRIKKWWQRIIRTIRNSIRIKENITF